MFARSCLQYQAFMGICCLFCHQHCCVRHRSFTRAALAPMALDKISRQTMQLGNGPAQRAAPGGEQTFTDIGRGRRGRQTSGRTSDFCFHRIKARIPTPKISSRMNNVQRLWRRCVVCFSTRSFSTASVSGGTRRRDSARVTVVTSWRWFAKLFLRRRRRHFSYKRQNSSCAVTLA